MKETLGEYRRDIHSKRTIDATCPSCVRRPSATELGVEGIQCRINGMKSVKNDMRQK